MLRKLLMFLFAAALVCALAATYLFWQRSSSEALSTGVYRANGRLEMVRVDVAAKYPGRLVEVQFQEGDAVQAGQVLAVQEDAELEELGTWIRDHVGDIFYYGNGSAGQDGHTVKMMALSGRAIPSLMYVDLVPNSDQISKMNVAVFLRGRWIDITPIAAPIMDPENANVFTALKEFMKTGLIPDLLEDLLSGRSFWDFLKSLTCELPGGQVFTLPTEGLANINLEASMASPNLTPPVETNNRMSRPKE